MGSVVAKNNEWDAKVDYAIDDLIGFRTVCRRRVDSQQKRRRSGLRLGAVPIPGTLGPGNSIAALGIRRS